MAARNERKIIDIDNRRVADRRINPDRRNQPAINGIKRVFNTSEACRYLRISRPTFLKLIYEGRIRARKIGRGWKVLESELERFLMAD